MTTAEQPPWVPLAGAALQTAQQDITAALEIVQDIATQFGPNAVESAMLAWIDTVIHYCKPPGAAAVMPGLPDGQRISIDDVEPSARWAVRMISARMNDDEQMALALLAAIPDDAQWTANIRALLEIVVLQLSAVRR